MDLKYRYDDIEFQDDDHLTFDVVEPGVTIDMTILDTSKRFSAPERLDGEDEDSIDLEALHPYKLTIYLQNKNKYGILKDAGVKVYTEIAEFKDVHYATFEEEGQKIPYSFVLLPPNAESSKTYKTNVSIEYTNEFDERHANSTEFSFTVEPARDIKIDLDSSEGTVLDGAEETEIAVKLTNDRLIDIRNVQVRDDIDERLHVEGVHAKKIKLLGEEETQVYSYRIKAPVVHNKTKYNITTTVSFFDEDLRQQMNFSKTTVITVKPMEPDLDIDITLDKPDEIYPGTLIPVEYVLTNNEELEVIRDITIHFPVQAEIDLIGPKTFFIDKLDPGEKFTILNILKFRPKVVRKNLEINESIVDYFDNYGNLFQENESADRIEVERAVMNGPALFLTTEAPDLVNKSAEAIVKINVINNGTAAADVTVTQGERMWNISVGAGSTKTIEYAAVYDQEGNFTIPDPYASFDLQGLRAHTKGSGTDLRVEMMLGPGAVVEEEVVEVEELEREKEKDEMSFAEYEALQKEQFAKRLIRYSIVGAIVVIFLAVIIFYIGYQRKKSPTHPFMEE
jgi:hypothetical protein